LAYKIIEMSLQKELKVQAYYLFRNRSYPPLPFPAAGLKVFYGKYLGSSGFLNL